MRIMKFGGKSLATLEKTQNICKNIKKLYKKDKKLIIIVSAMGDTTDKLLSFTKQLDSQKNSRELDVLLSTGETQSASIFALTLNSIGVPAKSFLGWQIKINTFGAHQNSLISHIDKRKIEECLNTETVVVVAGFQGINKDGEITTLGRGGSDTTALALGVTFGTEVELYSDFDGMFAIDPRVSKSKKLNSISHNQLERVTKNGTKIVSNRASKIAKTTQTNILLKSSEKFNNKPTIVNTLETKNILLSTKNNLCEITIDFENEQEMYFCAKNVINWLKMYKLYNFTVKNENIILLAEEKNKNEIIKILTKKLKI